MLVLTSNSAGRVVCGARCPALIFGCIVHRRWWCEQRNLTSAHVSVRVSPAVQRVGRAFRHAYKYEVAVETCTPPAGNDVLGEKDTP